MIRENIVFFREFLKEFQTTGSCFPTSKWAAKALSCPIKERDGPVDVLELGPGTGSVTVEILKALRDFDSLTICEINPRFMQTLKERLSNNPDYLRHRSRISFFEGPVQELPENSQYDVIVCALPFLNFDVGTVREIFQKILDVSKPNGVLTYYEYIGIRSASLAVSPPKRKERIRELDEFFHSVTGTHPTERKKIWLNLLPINVYTLRLPTH